MVFDYSEYDLTGFMESQQCKFPENQVFAWDSNRGALSIPLRGTMSYVCVSMTAEINTINSLFRTWIFF